MSVHLLIHVNTIIIDEIKDSILSFYVKYKYRQIIIGGNLH